MHILVRFPGSEQPPHHTRLLVVAEGVGLAGDQQADDEAEETQHGAENLNDQDLDEAASGVSTRVGMLGWAGNG